MPQKNLAQNETIEIVVPRDCNGAASMTTPSTTAAGAVFVMEKFVRTGTSADEWNSMTVRNEVTGLDAANITGASQSAWAEVIAARKIRVRRTDGTGGTGLVNFEWRRS